MSGLLGKCTVSPGSAAAIYTNSSGATASATLHALVPSTTADGCFSVNLSDCQTCIQTQTQIAATAVSPNKLTGIGYELSNACYVGYTTYTDSCGSNLSPLFTTTAGTTYGDVSLAGCFPCYTFSASGGLLPYHSSDLGQCTNCENRLKNITSWFHAPQWHLPCHLSNDDLGVNNTLYVAQAGSCCSTALITFHNKWTNCYKARSVQCKYIQSYSPLCTDAVDAGCYYSAEVCGSVVINHWHPLKPVLWAGLWGNPNSSQCLFSGMNWWCNVSLYCEYRTEYCFCNFLQASINQADGQASNIINYCCSCLGSCCCSDWQQMFLPHNRPFLTGKCMGIAQNIYYCTDDASYNCSAFWPWFNTSSDYCVTDQPDYLKNISCALFVNPSCTGRCLFGFCVITDVGRGQIKWMTHNPWDGKDYMLVMGTKTCGYDGIYEANASSIKLINSCCSGAWNSCKTFSEYISQGNFTKVGDIPSVWSNRTCRFEAPLHVQLVDKCCWVNYWPCKYWGESAGGWNGCFTKYVSSNLIDWEQQGDTVSFNLGCVNSSCDKVVISSTSCLGFCCNTNKFYNSSNVCSAGHIEYYTQANRLEKTGLVIGNGDTLYASNDGSVPVNFQIWGYDE